MDQLSTKSQKVKLGRKRRWLKTHPVCIYCGEPSETVDHKKALVLGGNRGRNNWVPSCYWCNQVKSAADHDEFIGFVEFMKQSCVGFPQQKPTRKVVGRFVKEYKNQTGIYIHRLSTPEGRAKYGISTPITFAKRKQMVLFGHGKGTIKESPVLQGNNQSERGP